MSITDPDQQEIGNGAQVRVTVAVLTFHRPQLLTEGLPTIRKRSDEIGELSARIGADLDAEILVVDNDPAASAREVVERFEMSGLRYVVEPTPGIAAARGRALKEAVDHGSDVIAFIDDDEEPMEGWLTSLLDVWHRTGAAGVAGRVVPHYMVQPEAWIVSGEFFIRKNMATGTRRVAAAAGNLLLDIAQLSKSGLTFEEPFGLTGGEDTLMTRRMTARGLRIVWCNESVVKDIVPAERLTRRWVLARAWSHGNNQALIDAHLASSRVKRAGVRLGYAASGGARVSAGVLQWVVGCARRNLRDRARGMRMVWRGAGVVSGAFGVAYKEYARPVEPTDRVENSAGMGSDDLQAAEQASHA